MNYYVDVILPLPLKGTFTYQVAHDEFKKLEIGYRVAVSFGKRKIYTGIVQELHNKKPESYETKSIEFIYDNNKLITQKQIDFWNWLSKYYFVPIGDIMKAAVPSTFLLESDSLVIKKEISDDDYGKLSDDEFLIYDALGIQNLKLNDISQIINKKNPYPIIQKMISSGYVEINYEIKEKYSPKLLNVIFLDNSLFSQKNIEKSFNLLNNSPKQKEILLLLISLIKNKDYIILKDLKKTARFSNTTIKSLEKKGLIAIRKIKIDRNNILNDKPRSSNLLSKLQNDALKKIKKKLEKKDILLLHGVTSSGKTEIYIKLIEDYIKKGQQILYLLPEISLTTQIIQKLKNYFGNKISVYHSRYSLNERTEVWENVKKNKENSQIVIGARSSIFLPFYDLGLIIVDEEHEVSYKQQEPSPRYNARDSAIYLSKIYKTKVILGSATPSIESAFNAKEGKYGLVEIFERYGDIQMPLIRTLDMRTEPKHEFNSIFSKKLVDEINKSVDEGGQAILFRNRRGYSPQWQCNSCGYNHMCDNCDVSLTYHLHSNTLRCHYCGFQSKASVKCSSCGMETMGYRGDGTQQIEEVVKEIFPKFRINRMDWDTTRGKWDFDKIINSFANNEIDILIGTQMITKGLDFKNVSLVGVINTDHFLNFPDFRAHEKAFQILTQVAGRSGRSDKTGKVFLQTYQPDHPIIKNVLDNNYEKMYDKQMIERKDYKYPPFVRLIKITMKDKSFDKLNSSSDWLNKAIRANFKGLVLGPVYPEISRIKNNYLKEFLVKLKDLNDLNIFRSKFQLIMRSFDSISKYRSVKIIIDVDPN